MAAEESNLWPWQQGPNGVPVARYRPPPKKEGEFHGQAGSQEVVPAALQRSLAVPQPKPMPRPDSSQLPWSQDMADRNRGEIPTKAPPGKAPALSAGKAPPLEFRPKAPPVSDPYVDLTVVSKKEDPVLVPPMTAVNMYEMGLIEQHGFDAKVAREVAHKRFQQGYFGLSPEEMHTCRLIKWLPMTEEEKIVSKYCKYQPKLEVEYDPTKMVPQQRKEMYQYHLQKLENLSANVAQIICDYLDHHQAFGEEKFMAFFTGPWSPRSKSFAPPSGGYTFEQAEEGLASKEADQRGQDPLQDNDAWQQALGPLQAPPAQPWPPGQAAGSADQPAQPVAQGAQEYQQAQGPGDGQQYGQGNGQKRWTGQKKDTQWNDGQWKKSGWGQDQEPVEEWTPEDQWIFDRRVEEEKDHIARTGMKLKHTWKPSPENLPVYIHGRFGMSTVVLQGKESQIWNRTMQFVDTRDKRTCSSFQGQHPIISWIMRDRGKNANNVQEAKLQMNDGIHGYLQVSSVTATDHIHMTFIWSYLHSAPIPSMSVGVIDALAHEEFKDLQLRRVYQQSGSIVIIQIVVRIGGLGYPEEMKEEWMVLAKFKWKSNDGDADMDIIENDIDDYVARQFRPPQDPDPCTSDHFVWDSGRAPSYRLNVVVLKGDGRVGAYTMTDQSLLWMLKAQPGKVEPAVCAMGKPYFVAEVQIVGKGSQDGVDGLPRFEMSVEDFCNQIIQKSDRTMASPSYLIVKGLKQNGLVEAVKYLRNLKIPPQILCPDQVLQAAQLARIHNWWIVGMRGKDNEKRLEMVRNYGSEDEATVHSMIAMGQQYLNPVTTNDLEAFGSMQARVQDVSPAQLNLAGPQTTDLTTVVKELKMIDMLHPWRDSGGQLPTLQEVRLAAELLKNRQIGDRPAPAEEVPAPAPRASQGLLGSGPVQAQRNAEALARSVQVESDDEIQEYEVQEGNNLKKIKQKKVIRDFSKSEEGAELDQAAAERAHQIMEQASSSSWQGAEEGEIS